MSFCYSFRKEEFPMQAFLGKIEEIIISDGPDQAPPGVWRELMVSEMIRIENRDHSGPYSSLFLTHGSIRGVHLSEEEDRISIALYSFASRSDQYLAARMAWEAMNLGATVDNDEGEAMSAADFGAETIEKNHQQWFTFSKACLKGKPDMRLPIYQFLSLKLEAGDEEKSADELERDLVARLTALADAYVCSRMGITVNGESKIGGILQNDLKSLMLKDVNCVLTEGRSYPMQEFVQALGDQVLDGDGCWIFPPKTLINPALFEVAPAADNQLTESDWQVMAEGPILAFLLVASADGKVDKKEIAEFGKVLTVLAMQQTHPVVARMMSMAYHNLDGILQHLFSGQLNPAKKMQAFTTLVNQRFTDEEAQMIKSSLMFLAEKVASSSGGFLGFGPKISKDEKEAIGALAFLLGLIG